MNYDYHYVHGHDCIHNLMTIENCTSTCKPHCNSHLTQYQALLQGNKRCVWALHPFNPHLLESSSYTTTCEEFGYTLDTVEHPWNTLSVKQLWEVFEQFNWAEHVESMNTSDIQNPDYIYTRWYNNVFAGHISSAQYWNTVLGPKTLPLDTVI